MTRSGRRALTRRNTRRIPNIFDAAPIMTVMMRSTIDVITRDPSSAFQPDLK